MKNENQKYILLCDNEPDKNTYTEKELIKMANSQREQYIKDKVDDEYIKENFPNTLIDLKEATDWLEGMGEIVTPISKELNETQRILKRLFENNNSISGKMEIKSKQYDEQGFWFFEIKILDLNDILNAKMQLVARKMCPSGIGDNGIKVIEHPLISLYEYKKDINNFVKTFIKRYFHYKKYYGSEYQVIYWEI